MLFGPGSAIVAGSQAQIQQMMHIASDGAVNSYIVMRYSHGFMSR